jgi:GTP-binding protein HflX
MYHTYSFETREAAGARRTMSRQNKSNAREKAVLVGMVLRGKDRETVEEHLAELAALTESAGGKTVATLVQERASIDPRTFIGRGKVDELHQLVLARDAGLVIFDDDLRPTQIKTLEEILEVHVMDRTGLILDIFANRAATSEAKIQVELAQLQYLLPRLTGMWSHLERQRGGIGLRGVGEKQIETDRRIIRQRIGRLKKDLEKVQVQRRTRRKKRQEHHLVALVGYTNAGKSTLFNALTTAEVRTENRLFVTLDTTVRTLAGQGGRRVLLSDTVGFIRKLPHLLVESFKGTLEEAVEADLLLMVVDAGDKGWRDHLQWSAGVLDDLGIGNKQVIHVFNKIDLIGDNDRSSVEFGSEHPLSIAVSATTGENIARLRQMILHVLTGRGHNGTGSPAQAQRTEYT